MHVYVFEQTAKSRYMTVKRNRAYELSLTPTITPQPYHLAKADGSRRVMKPRGKAHGNTLIHDRVVRESPTMLHGMTTDV